MVFSKLKDEKYWFGSINTLVSIIVHGTLPTIFNWREEKKNIICIKCQNRLICCVNLGTV